MGAKSLLCGMMIVATGALAAGCKPQPTYNRETLAAIKGESEVLVRTHPTKAYALVPKKEWPPAIAALRPMSVTVDPDGVDILIEPILDGGYGYYALEEGHEAPEPAGRYSALADGIYWYHPY